jgi:hypothetical protein
MKDPDSTPVRYADEDEGTHNLFDRSATLSSSVEMEKLKQQQKQISVQNFLPRFTSTPSAEIMDDSQTKSTGIIDVLIVVSFKANEFFFLFLTQIRS